MRLAVAVALAVALAAPGRAAEVVRVGSKSFTESYVLAEIAARVIERAGGGVVERRLGLGARASRSGPWPRAASTSIPSTRARSAAPCSRTRRRGRWKPSAPRCARAG